MTLLVQNTAQQVLDVIPLVMRTVRTKLREHRTADINVPQFRAMAYIDRNNGASLSDLATHIGLTLPAMSKLVDGLVNRKLVSRDVHSRDRRKVCLSLTPQGRDELNAAHEHTRKFLAEKMSSLAGEELRTISRAMQILKVAFAHEEEILLQTKERK
jgi:DNA-binding MarR family transcriptional regulator